MTMLLSCFVTTNGERKTGAFRMGRAGLALAALLAGGAASIAAEPGVTNTTIKLGMFGPLTGPVAIYGYPINNGAIAVYRKVNDEGGINGRKIEIVHEDGACDPAKTRAAVKKLISRDEVFAIHGGNCSAAVFASRDTFIEEKVPYMVMAATLDKISAPVSPYIYTATPAGAHDGAAMINFALSNPRHKKIAIITHTDEWANAKLATILPGIKKAGAELVTQEVIDRNANDATAQVLKIKAANPDVVLFVTYPGESAVFLRDALKFGLAGPFVGSNSVMDLQDLATRAGSKDAIKNVYVAAFLKDAVEAAGMKQYADLMRKYFPNDKVQSLNFYGMQGAFVMVDALKRAGQNLTREGLMKALNETKNFPAMSSYCTVTFSADNHQGCAAEQMWVMKGDAIVAVGDKWPQ